MPTFLPDKVIEAEDFLQETEIRRRFRSPRLTTHDEYIEHFYAQNIGGRLPVKPSSPPKVVCSVNCGRWLWKCAACGSGILAQSPRPAILDPEGNTITPAEPPRLSICPVCASQGWVELVFPSQKTLIEAELLKQPGRRGNAPIRQWRPGWTLTDLAVRTLKAKQALSLGRIPRSLSIGSTRTWSVGEILTAANMNTYGSDILDDLAGRNGEIQLEGPLKVNDGSGKYVELPVLTTTQRNALTPSAGMMIYNSTVGEVQVYEDDGQTTTWVGFSVLDTDSLPVSYSASNYSPSTADVGGHIAAIDSAIGSGIGNEASQGELEAESAVAKYVPPDLLHHSPGVPKAWALVTSAGTVSAGYNVTSVSHDSTGNWTVTIATNFSSANYAVVVTPIGSGAVSVTVDNLAAGTFTVAIFNVSTISAQDSDFAFICLGDQ